MEVLAAVAVVIRDQQDREPLVREITVALPLHPVMVVAVVLVHQVEMEILQMELLRHVQVELALQTTSLGQVHITAVAEVLPEM